MSIIRDIFYSNRGNKDSIKISKEYCEINKGAYAILERLEKGLTEEQKKLLDDLWLEAGGLEGEMMLSGFTEGFKVGLLIGKEVFGGE